MNLSQLEQYVCPACRSQRLELQNSESVIPDHIQSGVINCQDCGKSYPIVHGISTVKHSSTDFQDCRYREIGCSGLRAGMQSCMVSAY